MKKSIIAISLGLLSIFQLMADNDFVKGADVGFLPMQERFGQKFYDNSGNERECLDLLQDYGISAVRLRVWVNPKNGSNGKEEVLELAKRAKAKGMDIMLSFHYSDSWSDPAKQPIPHDWMGHSYEEMKQDIANHTVEVLTLLKDNGITPRWAQVNNGFDPELYDRNLGTILEYGGNFEKKEYPIFQMVLFLRFRILRFYPNTLLLYHVTEKRIMTCFYGPRHGRFGLLLCEGLCQVVTF